VLVVDLGQSGSRIRFQGKDIQSSRGKLNGENVVDSLRAIFCNLDPIQADVVALSATGFNGVVSSPDAFGYLCQEFFDAKKVAVIDDGLAGFIGALRGGQGVALTIGGGVVSVGGRAGVFAHRDGLGGTFGDEGSGFWLGKLGITKALGIRQGRGDDFKLLELLKECIDAFDALEVKNAGNEAATLAINSAQQVLEAADAGSPVAIEIREEGARLLAQTVIATWLGAGGSKIEAPEIAIKGGPAKNSSYVSAIQKNIMRTLPHVLFIAARGDNLDGATWIAENMLEDSPPLLRWASN